MPHTVPPLPDPSVLPPSVNHGLRDRTQHDHGREADPLARCHAVRLRVGTPPDPGSLAERITALAGTHRSDAWPAPGREPRLWIEEVPGPSDGECAARRREHELRRPVAPARGPTVRCVLLRYTDGLSDLIAVAERAVFGRLALQRLAEALLGRGPGSPPPAARPPCGPGWYRPAVPPGWGLGDPGAGHRFGTHTLLVERSGVPDPATWLAALHTVLGRYAEREPLAVAAVTPAPDPAGAETVRVVAVEQDRTCPLGVLADRLRQRLRQPTGPAEDGPGSSPDGPLVGLLVPAGADDPPDASAPAGFPAEYVPCLAPPFPLTVAVVPRPDGRLDLSCCYRRRYVSPDIAVQLVRQLDEVHRQVIDLPRTALDDADLFGTAERGRVLALGRSASPVRAGTARVHEAFAAQVAARPDAVALVDRGHTVTYRQLDRRADTLARGLREAGAAEGDRIGICWERSVDLVATLLAVLKAGGVYVPMDPSTPAGRLAYLVGDARPRLVVGMRDALPAMPDVRVATPRELADLDAARVDRPVSAAPASGSGAGPGDPAYVIYTSGSTGRPKGVVVPHANVVALIDATRDEYGLGPADAWTFFHSSAFDFSVWEIWGCLLTGGRLVVVPHWVCRSPDDFRRLLVDERVTVLSQTPSAFGQLAAADRRRPPALSVRLIVFGGEPLQANALLPWFDRYPETRCRVVNMFGITETTVHVTAQTLNRRHALERSRSVGFPLPGWHVYVMDSAQRLLPPGAAGEICVGGAGVALGYLDRPELTAERFLPDPFAGGVMYRSGDKGRLRPDGTLEHLGRLDNQVKVRGFRIELDEIRLVLLDDPDVTSAAVVLRHTDPVDPATARLDAYVVLAGGSPAEVRRRCARVLPDYMVPTTVTSLPALPLTTNGKLDVERLPPPRTFRCPPAGGGAGTLAEATPADDGLARDLLQAWSSVLGVDVHPDDDFFDLGGNSLFAVRIAAAMRDRDRPPVPVRELYLHPTVRRLTAALSGVARVVDGRSRPQATPTSSDKPMAGGDR